MTDFFEVAKRIVEEDRVRPARAYRRAVSAIESGGDFTLSDRELVAAATYAVRQDNPATAIVLLAELEFRLVADEPLEQIERRVA